MKTKAKGSRAEHRTRRLLEAAGYVCCKAGGSLGMFDIIAISEQGVRCIQVKSGSSYLSHLEREAITQLKVPAAVTRECWRWPDYCRAPLIEQL